MPTLTPWAVSFPDPAKRARTAYNARLRLGCCSLVVLSFQTRPGPLWDNLTHTQCPCLYSPMPTDPHNTADRTPHRNSVLAQLRGMQEVAYGLITDEETKASDVAQLMRAYVAAEQQRNVLRMRPAPKPIDVSDRKRKPRQRASVVSPAPQAAPAPTQEPQP